MSASSIRELPLAFVRSSASCVRNTHQLTSEERILRPAIMGDQFNTHPQPRTFAPSKEDVLQNLQYFFVRTCHSNPIFKNAMWSTY